MELVKFPMGADKTYSDIPQFRINTDYSHHRYDVMLLINGVPIAEEAGA